MILIIFCIQWITVSAGDDDNTHFRVMDTSSSGTFIYGPTRKGNAGYWVLGGIAAATTVAFLIFAFVRRNSLDESPAESSTKPKPANREEVEGEGAGIEMTSPQSSPNPVSSSAAAGGGPVTAAPIISHDASPRKDVTWSYVMDYQSAFPSNKGTNDHTLNVNDEHKVDVSKSDLSHDVHFVLHE